MLYLNLFKKHSDTVVATIKNNPFQIEKAYPLGVIIAFYHSVLHPYC